ncbi:MAG: pyridoxal-phosphate dependent enzyme, partial [Myxococcota bacterium]
MEELRGIPRLLRGARGRLWIKRDDLTSPHYGGNKVRTLELLFGAALARGASHVYSTGAYGSNHAAATVIHAPRVGLRPGVMLYPQPASPAALENLRVILSARPTISDLPHWSAFPLGLAALPVQARQRGEQPFIMMPGGAVAQGAIGYVSAAFELAEQVMAGALPRPRVIVLPVGSNCTAAGLTLGLCLAARHGLWVDERGRPAPPRVIAVRVTPWPVTTPTRILGLSRAAGERLAQLGRDP